MEANRESDQLEGVRRFVTMAWADYISAMASSVPYSICFHAQQEAEKMVKALLYYYGIDPPRTHNLEDLLRLCKEHDSSLSELINVVKTLRPYGVEIRYEASKERADRECPTVWEARAKIVSVITSKLPQDALVSTGYHRRT